MKKIKYLLDKVKNNVKNNKIKILLVFLMWILIVVFSLSIYNSSLGMESIGNYYYDSEDEIIELNNKTKIEQIINAKEGAKSVVLKFVTFNRNNKGVINIKVIGSYSNEIYANFSRDVDYIQDEQFTVIKLIKQIDKSIDDTINIVITSNSEPGNSIGIRTTSIKTLSNGSLNVNGLSHNNDLIVRYMVENADLESFNGFILPLLISMFTFVVVILFLFKPKYEYIFSLMVFVFGLFFIVIMTPYSIPDESVHYQYSNQLASKIMYNDHLKVDEGYYDSRNFMMHGNNKDFYIRLVNEWNSDFEHGLDYPSMNVDLYDTYKIAYIPQTVGLIIGRFLNLNVIKTFYLGRLTNLIFYTVFVYIAIKNSKINKILFGIIATLPIFIQQAASYSYDCFSNSIALVLISFVFKWSLSENKISYIDYAFILLLLIVLAPFKYVYGFLSLIFWFVPAEKFGSVKKKIILVSFLCFPVLIQLYPILLPRIINFFSNLSENKIYAEESSSLLINRLTVTDEIDDGYSLEYISSHMIETIKFVIISIRYNIKTWYYGSIGRYLSGLSITLPLKMSKIITLVLLLSCLIKEEIHISVSLKTAMLIVSGIVGLFTLAGMLVYWTNRSDQYIQGIQGRYFSPLLPYVFSCLNNKKIHISNKINEYIIFAQIILIFEVILYVLSYTFIN